MFRENPSLVGRCSYSVLRRLSASLVGRCQGKTLSGENPVFAVLLQENPTFWEKPVLSPVCVEMCCLSLAKSFSTDSREICWEKSLDLLLVLYQSSGDLCGFSWSFCSAGRLLFSTLLGEILAPLVGLWKLSAPSLLFLVLVGVGILFIRCNLRIRTFLGKNLFIRKTRG